MSSTQGKSDPLSSCGGPDHRIHRRMFLQGLAASAASTTFSWSGLFNSEAFADEVSKKQKHCILLWLCGGPSQFETWDPKPGRPTSGPFGSIPTVIPGVHVSELMPQSAKILDKLAVVRSMKTDPTEHFQAIDRLTRGVKTRQPFVRPALGSVLARELGQLENPIPNFILLDPCPEGNEFKAFKRGNWAGWLGAEYGPVRLGGQYRLEDIDRLVDLNSEDQEEREALRKFLSRKYENDRSSKAASSHNAIYERVKGLMSCADLFDLNKLPKKDLERYGPGTFGQHTLLARNLVENGAPFVMVANGMPWDCHVFNHEIYQMLVPDLDNIIYQLTTDLEERGLLEDTLVVVMGEFGRTPWLNSSRGRDHYPNAWSLAMTGAGIKPGVVVGATDEDGYGVTDRKVGSENLFATIFKALDLDPYKKYEVNDLPTFHLVEEKVEPIHEILS